MKPGDIVFLSASVPYREGWTERSRPTEIEEAIVAIARAVFARKGRLLFGGHPSVSPLVSSVASEYFPPDPGRRLRPVVTFQSEFFRGNLPDETWEMHTMGWTSIVWTDNVNKHKEASLELMREQMLGEGTAADVVQAIELKEPTLMFAVGGMEGIANEAAMFRRSCSGRKIYAFSSGGGAAACLAGRAPWPAPKFWTSPMDFSAEQGVETGELLEVESAWRQDQPKAAFADDADAQLQPYSAMAQWVLGSA